MEGCGGSFYFWAFELLNGMRERNYLAPFAQEAPQETAILKHGNMTLVLGPVQVARKEHEATNLMEQLRPTTQVRGQQWRVAKVNTAEATEALATQLAEPVRDQPHLCACTPIGGFVLYRVQDLRLITISVPPRPS